MLNNALNDVPPSSPLRITPAERAVLQLMADGRTTSEIAERLAIGRGDVDACLAALAARMGGTTRADAVAAAVRRGLVTLDAAIDHGHIEKCPLSPRSNVVGNEGRGIAAQEDP